MRNTFQTVIDRGQYDLTTLLHQIDRYHIEGKLSDSDRDVLYACARQQAAPQYDIPTEIEKLWAAVRALQSPTQEEGTDIPPFVQPSGAHDAYSTGDKVLYMGKTYQCLIDHCVWSPDVMPIAWQLMDA